MNRFLFLFIFLLTAQYSFSQKKGNKDAVSILDAMRRQESAWNNGDLKTFMQTYWKNDSLAFVGSKGVTYGWENVSKNYEKSYTDTVKMGKLHFDIIRLDVLDAKDAFVIGVWHLKRSIGDVGGHFTLLFKKFGNEWFIVVDHTS